MKFSLLAGLSFLFIATTTLAISKLNLPPTKIYINQTKADDSPEPMSPLPVLTGNDPFPVLSAKSAMVVDIDSGVMLYQKNPDGIELPASTTKIVTALVALDYYPLDKVLTVGNVNIVGQKMNLVPGEKITVENLLYGLLVYSANDAAEVLAQNYCAPEDETDIRVCGRDAFIGAMNKKTLDLELEGTSFKNPSGLDWEGHVTTSRDLIKVSEVAMKNPFFKKAVGTKEKTVTSTDGKVVHQLSNINELVGEVPGVLGVKTGWTENARENLVTYIERDGRKVMLVVLGSQDRFGETKEMINWVFANYTWRGVPNLSGSTIE